MKKLSEIEVDEYGKYVYDDSGHENLKGNNQPAMGWYVRAICEHIEAATRQETKKLLISFPLLRGRK